MARPQPRLATQGTLIHHRLAPAALVRAAETRRRCSSDLEGDRTARRRGWAEPNNRLRRVWMCTHFSWWMTAMLHASGDD
jgi:hypothetical protein